MVSRAPAREPIRMNAQPRKMTDEHREREIERCLRIGIDRGYSREARQEAFAVMAELIAGRSAEQVRRMEVERGITR